MKRYSLSILTDSLFGAICIALCLFSLLRYYTKIVWLSLSIGILAGCLVGICLYRIGKKRRRQGDATRHDQYLTDRLNEYLLFLSPKETETLLAPLFSDYCRCGVLFKQEPLTIDDVAFALRNVPESPTGIIGSRFSEGAQDILHQKNLACYDITTVYRLLKENDCLPPIEDPEKAGKVKRRKFHANKKLSWPLFKAGLALLLFSYFTFFPIYYLIAGSLLLTGSLITRLVS